MVNRQRTIGVVTVGRSDYGVYLPLLRALQAEPSLKLRVIVGGMHLVPEFGDTIKVIEADGFEISDRVEMLLASDTPGGIAQSMGIGTIGFAQAYARARPDLLVVLGDRFEMHAAAVAAIPFCVPIAHLAGGELTEGAIDNSLRHSITKLSHLHFAATEEYARRIVQMGEEPWRVVVSGALSLDHLQSLTLLDRAALEGVCHLPFDPPPLLVTYHPVTLAYDHAEGQIDALLQALRTADRAILFTAPNADTNGRVIRRRIQEFAQQHPTAAFVPNLGTQAYFSVMALAAAMVGNSSSGIVEAPSFGLPVVDIGARQAGRLRAANVIGCGERVEEIRDAIARALSPAFRERLRGLRNPYGDGRAAQRIVQALATVAIDRRLLIKKFHEPAEG